MKCEVELRRNLDRILVAGEALNGCVLIKINHLECINEINCQIVGYAKCSWSVESSIYSLYVGRVELLNANLMLLHKPKYGQLFPKGQHSFPFSFQLPQNLPSTLDSAEGHVKYKMLISIRRSGKSTAHFEYPFAVKNVVDLNRFPELSRPLLRVTSKEFAIDFTSKRLYMMAMIPQQGYVPGQILDVKIQIDNRSIVHVKYVKISLKKILTFTSQSPKVHHHTTESTEAVCYCDEVAAHTKKFYIKYLKIPQLPSNIEDCAIVKLSYNLQVKAKSTGATKSPVLSLPIHIGTIQLFRDDRRDYELEILEPRVFEFAPLSYDECMSESDDLIDLNLPSYDEAIRQRCEGAKTMM